MMLSLALRRKSAEPPDRKRCEQDPEEDEGGRARTDTVQHARPERVGTVCVGVDVDLERCVCGYIV